MKMWYNGVAISLVAALGACSHMSPMTGGSSQSTSQAPQPTAMEQAPPISPQLVKKVQSQLKNEGFYKRGAVDGIYGSRTESAVRSFQQDHNMEATGQLNLPTLHALNVVGEPSSTTNNTGSSMNGAGSSSNDTGSSSNNTGSSMNGAGSSTNNSPASTNTGSTMNNNGQSMDNTYPGATKSHPGAAVNVPAASTENNGSTTNNNGSTTNNGAPQPMNNNQSPPPANNTGTPPAR